MYIILIIVDFLIILNISMCQKYFYIHKNLVNVRFTYNMI